MQRNFLRIIISKIFLKFYLELNNPAPLGEGWGEVVKADIFHQPVAFNPNEITHAENALAASLNKYGLVSPDYMVSLTGGYKEELLEELKGKIYFNPIIYGYEVVDKFIAGNVIEKAEEVEHFFKRNPEKRIEESLKALQDAIPEPIRFEELDFNFGYVKNKIM